MTKEILINEMHLDRKNVNLALLESATNDLIELAISKDMISRNEYLSPLINAIKTYKLGCRELNAYDSFTTIHFKELKERISALMIDYEEILGDSLLPYKLYAEINYIKEYDSIDEKVYNKTDLNQKELLLLINMVVTRFHNRLKNDNYTEFDELKDAENGGGIKDIKKNHGNGKIGTVDNPNGKQTALIIDIRKEDCYTPEAIDALAIKYNQNAKSLTSRLNEVLQDLRNIRSGFPPEKMKRGRIISYLNVVIRYFEKHNEPINKAEAERIQAIVKEDKLREGR